MINNVSADGLRVWVLHQAAQRMLRRDIAVALPLSFHVQTIIIIAGNGNS